MSIAPSTHIAEVEIPSTEFFAFFVGLRVMYDMFSLDRRELECNTSESDVMGRQGKYKENNVH